ncbi:MAG TPA: DUF899 domain-containing protein [Opitutaceae bacterium]|nr:DUF899 domain-containing protein [Opitutaceae bacterium]
MNSNGIDYPRVASRDGWLKARLALLEQEKEVTRARDRVNTARRQLPMVRIEQDYVFAGPAGRVRLLDLFAGRHQLMIYHFMWLWENGEPLDLPCKGCASFADQIARGHLSTLRSRQTSFALVSRAPLEKIGAFQRRMGWRIPWVSSFGTRFNHDFGVTLDESIHPLAYNYRTRDEHERAGSGYYFESPLPADLHGLSCFLRRGDDVFHTYSTYGRGVEDVLGSVRMLDLTALGRQEEWEEPKGRAGAVSSLGPPPLYPDEYPEA